VNGRRRWRLCSGAFLLALTGCDWCEQPALHPDVCFASTFDYEVYPYEIDSPDARCGDPEYERNEDMTQAAAPDTPECNGSRTAHIEDENDVDVFRSGPCEGSVFLSFPSPVVASADVKGDANLRFCIFPLCEDGATNLQTCTGNADMRYDAGAGKDVAIVWDAKLDSGFVGCCRVGTGSITASFFCPGRARKVDTYFWVDAGELPLASTCSEYSFTFDVNAN
jgi:hypothetical protein